MKTSDDDVVALSIKIGDRTRRPNKIGKVVIVSIKEFAVKREKDWVITLMK